MPAGRDVIVASATPNPRLEGKVRNAFGAHFVEVEVDVELGRARVVSTSPSTTAAAINPLAATGQSKARRRWASGWHCTKICCILDRLTGRPLTTGFLLRSHSHAS